MLETFSAQITPKKLRSSGVLSTPVKQYLFLEWEDFCFEGRGSALKFKFDNFELRSNYIKFEENLCKMFHGGITDLK